MTFKIGTGAPTEDFNCKYVLSRLHVIVDKKFCRILGVFAISYFLSVDIYIYARLSSCQMQVDIPPVPVCRNIDVPAINSYRIGFGKSRRLWIARFEFITMIRGMIFRCPATGKYKDTE